MIKISVTAIPLLELYSTTMRGQPEQAGHCICFCCVQTSRAAQNILTFCVKEKRRCEMCLFWHFNILCLE